MPGLTANNLSSELNIILQFNGVLFTHADLLNFSYNNKINGRPFGEFLLVDRNSDFVRATSGDFGQLFFSNTTDVKAEKFSVLDFIIDGITRENTIAANNVFKIKWSSGDKRQLTKKTRSFSGISIDALEEVFSFFNASEDCVIIYLS